MTTHSINSHFESTEVIRELTAATAAAIRHDETVASRLCGLLVAVGRVRSTVELISAAPPALDRLAAAISEIIEIVLPDVVQPADDHLTDIRRFLLEPQESYRIEDLAR